ncbi:MAG: NAD(+)/NADH kinase [Treponema sp.]|nr:NAD(+)/NADH kinase [Treponema sp.]
MKKCLIIVNTHKMESQALSGKIRDFLKGNGIDSDILEFNGFKTDYPFEGYDFVITLGGDGTVLYACRGCAPLEIPVFPVNLGEFGFIAGISKEQWKQTMEQFLAGNIPVQKRTMLEATVYRQNKEILRCSCLNDILISVNTPNKTMVMDLSLDMSSLGRVKADGIIVATPTGSTAYSASAGGPIADPALDAMVLTPVNPFSLSMRPLVLNAKAELTATIIPSRSNDIILCADGQKPYDILPYDAVKITMSRNKALLIGSTAAGFYNALQTKLNWSGGPHA